MNSPREHAVGNSAREIYIRICTVAHLVVDEVSLRNTS